MIRAIARPRIIVPNRGVQRPMWPFALNRDSAQADRLKRWWAHTTGSRQHTGFLERISIRDLADYGNSYNYGESVGLYEYDYRYSVSGRKGDALMGIVQEFGTGAGCIYTGMETGDLLESFPFTLACWIYPYTNDTSLAGICSKSATPPYAYGLRMGGGTDWTSYINNVALGFARPTINAWHHIAVSVQLGAHRVYLDGLKVAESAVSDPPASTEDEFLIGTDYAPGSRPFQGRITDFRIYKKALSDAEVWQLYDPHTRWDLYYPLRQRVWFIPAPLPRAQSDFFSPMTGF